MILFNELFEHLHRNPIFTLSQAEAYAASCGVYDQWQKLELLGHLGHVREYTFRPFFTVVARRPDGNP